MGITDWTIVTCMCDYRLGLDWWMDILTTYTRNSEVLVIHSATANLHNSQITTTPAKPFLACCVFTSRSLATTSNSGDTSVSRAHAIAGWPPSRNWTDAPNSPGYNISAPTTQKTHLFHCCSSTVALLRICCLETGMRLQSRCPETVTV
jgi:hypothetical protein